LPFWSLRKSFFAHDRLNSDINKSLADIENAEQAVAMHLDRANNVLMSLSAIVTIVTTFVSLAAIIPNIFGELFQAYLLSFPVRFHLTFF
jgi:hypothetical protein